MIEHPPDILCRQTNLLGAINDGLVGLYCGHFVWVDLAVEDLDNCGVVCSLVLLELGLILIGARTRFGAPSVRYGALNFLWDDG